MNAMIKIEDINAVADGEPRILDITLAEALGFAEPRMIRKLIQRHRDALVRFGEVCSMASQTAGSRGGRPSKAFLLNKKQALYICTKSETPNATDATIEMVEVFDAYTSGKLVAVRPYKRALPTIKPKLALVPKKFESGSDLLRDLHAAVSAANIRMEQGSEQNFGKVLEGVLSDTIRKNDDPTFQPKGTLMDWNWRRIDEVNGVRYESEQEFEQRHAKRSKWKTDGPVRLTH